MVRRIQAAILLAGLIPLGCMTGPRFDNPMHIDQGPTPAVCENPILIYPRVPGREAYAEVFDRVVGVVDDYFQIEYANRYEGRVVGKPTIAPGFEQIWKPGSPDLYERTLASMQAYRYRCEVRIREADPSGYFVQVTVRKELKDYPSPASHTPSVPVFGDVGTVDRSDFMIVDPEATSPLSDPSDRWIPKGREPHLEQAILRKLQQMQ
jgi:hypothetical protein